MKDLNEMMKLKIMLPEVETPWGDRTKTKRLIPVSDLGEQTLRVLGVPFGGHIMGRDAYGEAFHAETDIWLQPGDVTPVTYYHGFGPDDPWDWQAEPAVIGLATLAEKDDERGWWFEVRLDESEPLALRVKAALEAEQEVRASSGAVGHLVRYGEAGLINVWPVGELALFDTNDWRKPANELAVVELMKATTDEGQDAEIALEVEPAGFIKSVVDIEDLEAALQEEDAQAPADSLTNQPLETSTEEVDMNAEEMQALIDGVSAKLGPQIDAAIDARLPAQQAGMAVGQVEVVRDEADQPWKTRGEFFQAVKKAALYPGREDPRLRGLKATGMSEDVPADGGYLVPEETASGILDRMYDTNKILSRIAIDPVTGNSMKYNAVDESTHVGSMYGGIVGYWLNEGGTITGSKPKFGQLRLELSKVAALCYATDEQLEDTPNLDSWLTRTVPNVLRFYAEDAIVEGNGVGKPLGILNGPCLVQILRETANTVTLTDVANLWSRRWAEANDYVWLINPTVSAVLNTMTAATAPVYMPAGNIAGSPFGTLYGAPVIEVEYCPALGTAGDIILASLSNYQAISKGGVKSAQSIHVAFVTDETAFRFTYRIDGAPAWLSTLTPLNGSTVSPFVSLYAASA